MENEIEGGEKEGAYQTTDVRGNRMKPRSQRPGLGHSSSPTWDWPLSLSFPFPMGDTMPLLQLLWAWVAQSWAHVMPVVGEWSRGQHHPPEAAPPPLKA